MEESGPWPMTRFGAWSWVCGGRPLVYRVPGKAAGFRVLRERDSKILNLVAVQLQYADSVDTDILLQCR